MYEWGIALPRWISTRWRDRPTQVWVCIGALLMLWAGLGSLNLHDKIPSDDWKHSLRSDAAGYYVYLPAFFHHGWKAHAYSDDMVRHIAGEGFQLDRQRDRVVTKYPIGTAMLQLPFFLMAEAIEGPGATDGWSRTHHRAIELAGIFYWVAGMILLALTLTVRYRGERGTIALVIAAISFGTNVFYYAYRFPGYSHIYSFFLISASIYIVYTDKKLRSNKTKQIILMILFSLIILIRHIDVLAVIALLTLVWFEHPTVLRSAGYWWQQLLIGFVLSIPQLAYWKHVHGKWVVYAYGDEGFANWADPEWALVLFAPENGILPYSPILVLMPIAMYFMWKNDSKYSVVVSMLFLLVIYSFAAWHVWHFGCSYGKRPFVQFMPFIAMPMMALLVYLHRNKPVLFGSLVTILVLVLFINYRLMLDYEGCFFGKEPWDWDHFGVSIARAFLGRSV